ncbi:tetraacyldisaccharide 4'-kinase [Shewanella sp. AS16]|uniref:tetraacyldisaccharide 4'-kinase n=1 Tax=Shewanella sp. AS16 TaxID=2907625 RepID=UPI001F1ACAB1|nr:tetraacyldisaccharide 4'-kinase [Shewanella sp. AS16]MCE9687796.1 tetraacyldisaccharide 4'-kinase [Shewanella sp. AS16]
MQAWVNRLWYLRHPARWLLAPLSLLFMLLTALRRSLYRLGLKKTKVLPVPVIVVGNISVGGVGKTPTVLYLIQLLRAAGYKPGVISRGYGIHIDGVKSVLPGAKAEDVGDEPAMIVARTRVPMVVGPNRIAAGRRLIAEFDVDVILCDDGLQHYALHRDLELAILDGERRLGNGLLLPAGPLREGAWRLQIVDWVLVNGGEARAGEWLMTLQPGELKAVGQDTRLAPPRPGQEVIAMAAIGHPARFFGTLETLGYRLKQGVAFADHQAFQLEALQALARNLPLLMTEKDAVKCRDFAQENWWYLAVDAKIAPQFDSQLLSRLKAVIEAKRGTPDGIR